ncbi:MAG TPA: SUMF1/EgtB/PvdO family nonheme iron enzyme, partial [Anaerolineales bacterium]|nr:SUMF1/EgtB/PvdO family nonheme iron enzyme [Anaerolineales bacterium]
MPESDAHQAEIKKLEEAIQALEGQRAVLGDAVVDQAQAALREKLQNVGAKPQGSGASAVGEHARAVGDAGLMVGGDVGGDALAAGAVKIELKTGEVAVSPEAMRRAYLNRCMENARYLSLAGIDPKAASEAESRLNLGAVYTALMTLTPAEEMPQWRAEHSEREARRLSALEQLNRQARLVLLGDPGSGKSTFINFVSLCLAGEALADPSANLSLLTAPLPADEERPPRKKEEPQPQPWDHQALLPVRVILRDFAARGLPEPGEAATAEHLWRFIAAELGAATLGDYAPHLQGELLKKGGLLMLDGLDEIPEAGRRRLQLKQAVEDFAATYPKCRILVTSRTYAYQRQDWRLNGFQDAELAPFSRGQITRFIDGWYSHIASVHRLDARDAQGRAELLKRAVLGSDRLMGLAERPLLLTLMASLHAWRGGTLPEKREQLYADTVELLLDWWESPKVVRDAKGQVVVQQPSLAEWLQVDKQKMRDVLNELAFRAHSSQADLVGTADIPEGDLVSSLIHLSENPEVNPVRLVEYLSHRAGLLLPRGLGVYTFPHRTFQEYLAACYLTDREYPEQVAELARDEPERWREVALLAGAKAARGTTSAIWSLVDALCFRKPGFPNVEGADVWGAHLAGQALVEGADLRTVSERNQGKVDRVKGWLIHILQNTELPATERAAAGDNLARLGDPRFDPGRWHLPAEPDLGFIDIPAGEFLMGSDPKRDKDADDNEQPQHKVHLPTFYIARNPVTVAQFRAFVEDSGYMPSDDRCLLDPPSRPVRYVTWYDVLAYCGWLG